MGSGSLLMILMRSDLDSKEQFDFVQRSRSDELIEMTFKTFVTSQVRQGMFASHTETLDHFGKDC
jgi:hypothetical protein